MSTCQFWTERMEQTMDKYFKTVLQNTDTLMSDSFTPFYIWMWNIFMTLLVDVWIWKKMFVKKLIVLVIVVCWFFFFQYGLFIPVELYCDGHNNESLEYKYFVNELLFDLTNNILLLCEKNVDRLRLNLLIWWIKRKRHLTLWSRRNRG